MINLLSGAVIFFAAAALLVAFAAPLMSYLVVLPVALVAGGSLVRKVA